MTAGHPVYLRAEGEGKQAERYRASEWRMESNGNAIMSLLGLSTHARASHPLDILTLGTLVAQTPSAPTTNRLLLSGPWLKSSLITNYLCSFNQSPGRRIAVSDNAPRLISFASCVSQTEAELIPIRRISWFLVKMIIVACSSSENSGGDPLQFRQLVTSWFLFEAILDWSNSTNSDNSTKFRNFISSGSLLQLYFAIPFFDDLILVKYKDFQSIYN